MPYRPAIMRMDTENSSTEDFRSVIDDLTVANKRLKAKLKKYEKLYDAHLQDEKLFEVRFHGLPDHKKKELEETLRKFAADLDESLNTNIPPISTAAPLEQHHTTSSASRFAESGYASMSVSGQNSTSAPSGQDSDRRQMSKSQYNRQQQSIHSYLHDIPVGLLPKHNVPMTEKSKKKLVVRRLEQIFAGKRSAPGNHPQPMQQEEVAQSAAMDDRRAKEASGQRYQKEGLREARIMPVRSEDEDIVAPAESVQKLRPGLYIQEHEFAGANSPNQRPTRPLDLDPYRAQIPAENMEYIRHLGFTPPDTASGEAPEDGHGWIYLNLLINMAQLHTINVTPDFVKDAIIEYSSAFELSHDGRKIRWKGSSDLTLNSETSSEPRSGASPYDILGSSSSRSPSKRMKTENSRDSNESSIDPESKARREARAVRERDQRQLAYTPLFFHKQDSEEDDDFDIGSSSNSLFHAQQRGDSSGLGSSAMRSSSSRKRREDGPIIFYNKAKFCTDLSGDRRGLSIANPASYKSITSQPLGATSKSHNSADVFLGISEPRGPLNDTTPMDVDQKESERTTSSEEEIGFSPQELHTNESSDSTPSTMEFEASGIGGVQPNDNFAIRVKRSHVRAEASTLARYKAKKMQLYPRRILEALNEQQSSENEEHQQQRPVIKEEILSASRKDLPSSTLPPASFLPFDSTSSGDVDSDLESDVSSNPSTSSSSDRGPATALRLLNISPMHPSNQSTKDKEGPSEEGGDSDSDGSVDFLATARQLDPKTVMASEREYDATLADRLAEEIPAGSSAATAGGGSGFNSPMSVQIGGGEDAESTKRPSHASSSSTRAKNLKRARTSDSIATALQQPGKTQKLN